MQCLLIMSGRLARITAPIIVLSGIALTLFHVRRLRSCVSVFLKAWLEHQPALDTTESGEQLLPQVDDWDDVVEFGESHAEHVNDSKKGSNQENN